MIKKDRFAGWLVAPLRLLPGNLWGRFWWWYWEKQGISREEQQRLIEEVDAEEATTNGEQ